MLHKEFEKKKHLRVPFNTHFITKHELHDIIPANKKKKNDINMKANPCSQEIISQPRFDIQDLEAIISNPIYY